MLLLGLLAEPRSIACRALDRAGLDLLELRHSIESKFSQDEHKGDARLSPEAQDLVAPLADRAQDHRSRAMHLLSGLLTHSAVLAPHRPRLDVVVEELLRGRLDPNGLVFVGGVSVGMSGDEVVQARGEPAMRSTDEDTVWWKYGDLDVGFQNGHVVAVHGRTLEQNRVTLVRTGDPVSLVEDALGVKSVVFLPGPPMVKIHGGVELYRRTSLISMTDEEWLERRSNRAD